VISLDQPLGGADGDDGGCREIADTKAQPDERFEGEEIIVQVNEALEQLPKQFKNVFVLRELYGLSYDEIALRMNSRRGTVKSRIARARTKMQSHLGKLNCA